MATKKTAPTASPAKATIYLDPDDDITTVIDKFQAAEERIVALVLPKRFTTLSSILNVKLLKKAADQSNKRIVLITSDNSIVPIAGATGVYVAKTLQSKPAIPDAPQALSTETEVSTDDKVRPAEEEVNKEQETGSEAEGTENSEPEADNSNRETEVPDEAISVDSDEGVAAAAVPVKKNRKLKVPNFEKFRLRLVLGITIFVLLLVGWFFAYIIMPKAIVTITTDNSVVDSNQTLIADPKATAADDVKLILPATVRTLKKSNIDKFEPTGQKDKGNKSTGTVTLTNCDLSPLPITVPAGTGVSTAGLTFITAVDVTIAESNFTGGGACKNDSFKDVAVTAQNPGDKYNLSSGRTFAVSGYSGFFGKNSAGFTGGTSNLVKAVSQADVDASKTRMTERANTSAQTDLISDLAKDGYTGLNDTFATGTATVTATPAVGAETAEVVVTLDSTFTMVGVPSADLKRLTEADISKHIDAAKQQILDNGLGNANIHILDKPASGQIKFSLQVSATAGASLDADTIKKQIAGKKRGDVTNIIQSRPGIKDVSVEYKPFWIYSTPKATKKITIIFQQQTSNASGP